jgi:hypothetical protein
MSENLSQLRVSGKSQASNIAFRPTKGRETSTWFLSEGVGSRPLHVPLEIDKGHRMLDQSGKRCSAIPTAGIVRALRRAAYRLKVERTLVDDSENVTRQALNRSHFSMAADSLICACLATRKSR